MGDGPHSVASVLRGPARASVAWEEPVRCLPENPGMWAVDQRLAPLTASVLVAVTGLVLHVIAPGGDALCGPDAIECWDPLEVVADLCLWCGGVGFGALVLSWKLASAWGRAGVATLGGLAAPVIFFLAAFTVPGGGCEVGPCVPRSPVVLTAGVIWGWAIGSVPRTSRPVIAQTLGATGGLVVVLLALYVAR
jgi:hypothetical protein